MILDNSLVGSGAWNDQLLDWGFEGRWRCEGMNRAAEACLPSISKEECSYLLSMLASQPEQATCTGPCRGLSRTVEPFQCCLKHRRVKRYLRERPELIRRCLPDLTLSVTGLR